MTSRIEQIPWDARALGCSAWEVKKFDEPSLLEASSLPGLITVKVPAQADKQILQQFGFYYVDTLIEPYCDAKRLRPFHDPRISINSDFDPRLALDLAYSGFEHGRFYRDYSIPRKCAQQRYRAWLQELIASNQVTGLFIESKQAGFIAVENGNLKLHAVDSGYRNMGLAKHWWHLACVREFKLGIPEVKSSISSANLPVVSLYASLGFRFRDATDIYHRFNKLSEVATP